MPINFYDSFAQFGDPSKDISSSKLKATGGMIDFVYGSLLFGQSKSTQIVYAPSQYSKPYVLFTATDAASAVIGFSKYNLQIPLSEDGRHPHSISQMKHGLGNGCHPSIEVNLQTSLSDDGHHPLCISLMKPGSSSWP